MGKVMPAIAAAHGASSVARDGFDGICALAGVTAFAGARAMLTA